MKKIVFAIMLLVSVAGYSQTFQLGLKAGVNISNFTGSAAFEDVKKSSLIGFYGGGFVGLFFGENFSVQPEILFSSQGAKIDDAGDKENFKLTYLNVPVMLKYEFKEGFYVEAGPQVGFKIGESVPGSGSTDEKFAKGLDLSIGGGIGYHSKIGLGIGARYLAGLSKVGDFNSSTEPNFHNSVIQIGLFYTIFNNKK